MKALILDLAFHCIDVQFASSGETADQRPDPVVRPTQRLLESRTAWLAEVDEAYRLAACRTLTFEARRRHLVAALLVELRRTAKGRLWDLARDPYIPGKLQRTAMDVVACGTRHQAMLMVLVLEDVRWWELDMRRQWVDQSPLAQYQQEMNAKQENYRDPKEDEILLEDGSTVVATNAPSTGLDARGFHRETTRSRKAKRWAYCPACSAAKGEEVWFMTSIPKDRAATHSAKRYGTDKRCNATEGVPPVRDRSPLHWVVRRYPRRHGETRTMYWLFTKTARGWLNTSVARYVGDRQQYLDQPMELCPRMLDFHIRRVRAQAASRGDVQQFLKAKI